MTTMPGYWGILFVWALFGVTCDMMNWPVLLKSVSRLGNSEQQGRLFGFFETAWHCRYRGGIFCVGSIYLVWQWLIRF